MREKSMVAATFEKAITYVFAKWVIHNPKVGSSSLPPATNGVNYLQRPAMAACALCPICVHYLGNQASLPRRPLACFPRWRGHNVL